MPRRVEHVETPDGRTLAVEIDGELDGDAVLVHNGTPSSRSLYDPAAADARAQGLVLLSYDRPGYGGSTSMPGRTIGDCAADVRAIAASLGIERMGVWGASGGGPHALACAALLGDLVPAVAVLASSAPYGAQGLDYFAGMGQENVDDVKLLLADEGAARAKLARDRLVLLGETDGGEEMESLISPVDAAALAGPFGPYMSQSFKDGLAPGGEGWWEDSVAHVRPWGFELGEIGVPVLLMHGREDLFVPCAHGEWLAAHVPGAEARISDTDGHITLITERIGEVHAWLAERL